MQPVVDGLQDREGRREQPPSAPANKLQRSGVVGLPMGFVDLDRFTGGLPAGDLWVVMGRSGVGKTMLTLGFARGAAIGRQVAVAVLAGRGTVVDTATMLLSAEARVPLHYLRFGGPDQADWARLARRMGEVAGAPLFPMHAVPEVTGFWPVASRVALARDAVARHDLALLVLDDMPGATTPKEPLGLKALAVRARTPRW